MMLQNMRLFYQLFLWFVALLINIETTAVSHNQPKFCRNALWNSTGTILANESTPSDDPHDIFVDKNNIIYALNRNQGLIQVYHEENSTLIQTISGGFIEPLSIFVTIAGDIYIDNGFVNGTVERWSLNQTIIGPVLNVNTSCQSLFVDIYDTIYCSMRSFHQIVAQSMNQTNKTTGIIAGMNSSGSSSFQLNEPCGIFVDIDLNLYVADYKNNRIQKFKSGYKDGKTVVGSTALDGPIAVILDSDQYLFVLEFDSSSVIRLGPNGFQCIVSCLGSSDPPSGQLNQPRSLHFDSYGNIIIADSNHSRLLKFTLATNSCGPSYNRPKLSSCARWNSNGVTLANKKVVGNKPSSVYVDINNNIYVVGDDTKNVQVWLQGNITLSTNISLGIVKSHSVFATIFGDIYFDHGKTNRQIMKWTLDSTNSTIVTNVSDICYGLFIDHDDNLYCSITSPGHQVVRRSLYSSSNNWTIMAGTISPKKGNSATQLEEPRGIFVDTNFTLYVADCTNDRIQCFLSGQINGTTVAGQTASTSFKLDCPTGVILDFDGYLFISDYKNNRIVRSGPKGFECLFGCNSKKKGSSARKLTAPNSLSFDSYGNIYVADTGNDRIQKFSLLINTCGVAYNQPELCFNATWESEAITFQDNSAIGIQPSDIFIDLDNTIYVAETDLNRVQVWIEGNLTASQTISSDVSFPSTVLATTDNEIYISNYNGSSQVRKWTSGVTIPSLAIVIAGIGSAGSATNMLFNPRGIFVDINYKLYVADCGNNRIQLFSSGTTSMLTTIPSGCISSNYIGHDCNISVFPCDMLQPCQNNATCINNNTVTYGYTCSCLLGFNGTECQYDQRPCQSTTCWNNGMCLNISNTEFICQCIHGWQNTRCQTKIDYCQNITCLNNGICQGLLLHFTCICLSNSYSGRYCEFKANSIKIYETVSKSLAYIAIIAMIGVAMFIIVLDILKYCFKLDPVDSIRQELRRKKHQKTTKSIQFIYVNAMPVRLSKPY
ncbi:hypothetical protein I4U23_003829 [Adineta vaga]|nr:hypothetical protein I4U23_003829 [Adineta vaga]